MARLRRLLLTALPKVALSRTTRVAANLPLPRWLRGALFRAFARRYGAALAEAEHPPEEYRSLAAFFQRALRAGARPIATTPLVWPADGRLASCGPVEGGHIEQIKGIDYAVADLVADAALAERLAGGSQATVYLAPGDYHRIHAPFDARIVAERHVPGGLFPVNAGAVRSIPQLFIRNERLVLEARLPDGRAAAVVLVAALNVSDTVRTCAVPGDVVRGDELGRFGLGSTVVVLLGPGQPGFAQLAAQTVRTGAAAAIA